MRRLLPPLRSFLGTGSPIGSIVRVLSHSIWSWVRQWRYKTGSADCLCWHFIFKSRQWFSPSTFWMFYIRKYSFLYFDISEDFICMLKWMYKWNSWYEKRENMTYCSAHRLFVNVIDHVDSFNENKSTNELDFNFRLVYQCDLPQIIPSSGKS